MTGHFLGQESRYNLIRVCLNITRKAKELWCPEGGLVPAEGSRLLLVIKAELG